MEYLIASLVILSVWHYMYENIVLPAIHTSSRNKFFSLRDELRQLYIDDPAIDGQAFNVAHEGINTAIFSVDRIDLSMQFRLQRRFVTDSAFKNRVMAREKIIKETSSAEIRDIVRRANEYLRDAFVYNSSAWFIYIIPIALVVVFSQQIMKGARELFSLSETDAGRMFGIQQAMA
ncbi:hypothetical protein [Dyella nitratireducens]|uniref:Uncharacterized protein n=1 Tax=Dyella nitratireducens TaxID=1849580 RepID=A0ABQ1FUT8_9GAMM|nr:hypothetical protein [Dyella nitratireducens]GGA28780.1 hypothetical protein GCM10010981_17000 [Dyella nitratireducens]GLQ43235.1 hypothetical protein GCM10007902_30850 [Dyella nitratireducens]